MTQTRLRFFLNISTFLFGIFFFAQTSRASDENLNKAESLHSLMLQQVDQGKFDNIIAIASDSDAARKLARDLLGSLWKDPEYRRYLSDWVGANPKPIIDDLFEEWIRKYHGAFIDSLEFVDQENLITLWRLARSNIIGDLPRSICSKENEEINLQIQKARNDLLNEKWSLLAKVLPPAFTREFKRRNTPQKGDHPVMAFMIEITRNTLQATAQELPESDRNLLLDMFSYGKQAKSKQEVCERFWVSSRAIQDSKINDSKQLVSSNLMRQTMIPTAVAELFSRNDQPIRISRPQHEGFKSGTKSINLPLIGVRNKLEGSMNVHVNLENTGKPIISLISSDLKPIKLVAIDQSVHDAATVMLRVVDAYFKGGSFSDSAKSFDVDITWKKP